ncbi:MAG: S8 family serine peptidase [Deltaproteobacteria bacterium]|nr:S8 family serine peptidase [Deltaproteobacteria bacterium]
MVALACGLCSSAAVAGEVGGVPVSPSASGLPSEPAARTFLNGGKPVTAVRLGRAIASRPDLAAVRLTYADGQTSVAGVGRRAIVQIDPELEEPQAVLRSFGLVAIRALMPRIGLWLVEDAGGARDGLALATDLAVGLSGEGTLRQAIPDLYLAHRLRAAPNDPLFSGQSYFNRLKMVDAWALSQGSPDTTVVVVDNGCDLQHPDLAAKMDQGRDVVTPDDDPSYVPGEPGNEHGTACSGLVGAVTNNGVGIAGGCPECRLRCVRMLGADAEAVPVSADVDAFQFALEVDADVVSNSWGFVDPTPVPQPLADAINAVFDSGRGGRGALVVFAAGNDGRELGTNELEAVRGVLCISAVNVYDEATQFTNFGSPVDLAAPAGTVTTDVSGSEGADFGDYTANFGGTSSACPVAAGIAGLLVSAAPDKTAAELYALLIDSARRAPRATPDANGHDPLYGYGIVDPVAALRLALGVVSGGDGDQPAKDGGGCHCRSATSTTGLGVLAIVLWMRRRRR